MKIQKFKTSRMIYQIQMEYNVHDVLNFLKIYITLNSKSTNIFWYDFKLSSFIKMKHKICKESIYFYKFILIRK